MNNDIFHYKIVVDGIGSNLKYYSIQKLAFDYWSFQQRNSKKNLLIDFFNDPQLFKQVPPYANIFQNESDLILAVYGAEYRYSKFSLYEIDSDNIGGNTVQCLVDSHDIVNFQSRHPNNIICNFVKTPEKNFMLEINEEEKGVFFEGIFSTQGKFEEKHLKFTSIICYNNDHILTDITYKNESIKSQSLYTQAKNLLIRIWKK